MTTYGIREFKARVSEILRGLDEGEDVIITRRGKPCGRLTSVRPSNEEKPSLDTLKGALSYLPDASYEDFLDVKTLWKPRVPASTETKRDRVERSSRSSNFCRKSPKCTTVSSPRSPWH